VHVVCIVTCIGLGGTSSLELEGPLTFANERLLFRKLVGLWCGNVSHASKVTKVRSGSRTAQKKSV
jgi:hypothetical protein